MDSSDNPKKPADGPMASADGPMDGVGGTKSSADSGRDFTTSPVVAAAPQSDGDNVGQSPKGKGWLKRELTKLFIYIGIGFVVFGAFIASPLYDWAILRPHRGGSDLYKVDHVLGVARQELMIPGADGNAIHTWYFAPKDAKRLIIVNHGNAGNITHRLFLAKDLLATGNAVILYDYRGYGLSQGSPSLKKIVEDGVTVYQYAIDKLGYAPEKIIAYGESIGSGVTCQLASKHKLGGIILQSTFASMPSLGKDAVFLLHVYPDALFPEPHMDNDKYLAGSHPKVLFVQGEKDYIPMWHFNKFFDGASEPKVKVVAPHSGHNDIGDSDHELFMRGLQDYFASLE